MTLESSDILLPVDSKVTCYRCGKLGHVSSQCRKGLLRQLRLHLEAINPDCESLVGSLITVMQAAKQIPLNALKMLNLDFKGVFYLRKINTNRHFTRSSTVEAYLNEIFTSLSLDELTKYSKKQMKSKVKPIINEKKEKNNEKKNMQQQISDFRKEVIEHPENHISVLKTIMPNYDLKDLKVRDLKDEDKAKVEDACLDPAFKREVEIFFDFNRKRIPEIKKLLEENRRVTDELKNLENKEREIKLEEKSTRNMLYAADPEVKREEKEIRKQEKIEKQNRKEFEERRKNEYLRKRDQRNYEIQKQRLEWDKMKFDNYMKDRKCQQYKDEYNLQQDLDSYQEFKDTVDSYRFYNGTHWDDALKKKNDYVEYKKTCYNKKYGKKYKYHPDTTQ